MDRFVTRAPTWKTLNVSSFSRSFANNSLTGNKSTPKKKEETQPRKLQEQLINDQTQNRRLSIRDERLLQIFSSQPDQPLVEKAASYDSSSSSSDSFICSGRPEFITDKLLPTAPANNENFSPNQSILTTTNDTMGRKKQTANSAKDDNPQRPTTPVSAMIPSNLARTPIDSHPFMARIQRDLNSPSAATRIRALKALRSPTKSAYANFDIPHEEQDIITEEERQSPEKPKSVQELMKDVVVYVEVRTGEDNRSAGVKKVISALGAKVNDKLLRGTTHVVFKDGLLSTYNKAKKWDIPIVSILWIEACKNQCKLINPKHFPISNADRYENPELYDKMKRHKSMQPDAEENRRVRAKASTLKDTAGSCHTTGFGTIKKTSTIIGTPSSANSKKTDISRFFMQLGNNRKGNTINENDLQASPATQLLDRIHENIFNPAKKQDFSLEEKSSEFSGTPKSAEIKKTLNFISAFVEESPKLSKSASIVRRNSIQTSTCFDEQRMSLSEATTQSPTPGRTRRRSSINIATNINISENVTPSKRKRKNTDCDAIAEEEEKINCIDQDTTLTPSAKRSTRRTTFTMKPLDTSETSKISKTSKPSRRTMFTPKAMDECSVTAVVPKVSNKRRTISTATKFSYTDESPEGDIDPITPVDSSISLSSMSREGSLTKTPIQLGSLLKEHASATIFSSTKSPNRHRRRTLFDVSMDIISQRLQNINQSAKSNRLSSRLQEPDSDRNSLEQDTPTRATVANTDAPASPLIANENIRKELLLNSDNDSTKETAERFHTAGDSSSNSSTSNTTAEVAPKKKRKLYFPNVALLTPTSDDSPPSTNKRVLDDVDCRQAVLHTTSKTATNRRKTLMPTSLDSNAQSQGQNKTTKSAAPSSISVKRTTRRSTMDFESMKNIKTKLTTTPRQKKSAINIGNKPTTTDQQSALSSSSSSTCKSTVTERNGNAKNTSFLVYTNMHSKQIEVIKEAIATIGHFQLEDNVSDKTTHIVSLEPRRTLNILRALARGLWIVNYNWILDSKHKGLWLDEEQYELREFSRAVEICRSERQAFGFGYKIDLFAGLGAIYISSKNSPIPKENLRELILLCSGRVVEQRKRAKYIIGDPATVLSDKVYLNPYWILDSITNNQIQKLNKYMYTDAIAIIDVAGKTEKCETFSQI